MSKIERDAERYWLLRGWQRRGPVQAVTIKDGTNQSRVIDSSKEWDDFEATIDAAIVLEKERGQWWYYRPPEPK